MEAFGNYRSHVVPGPEIQTPSPRTPRRNTMFDSLR
jgi:hypothetical protein